MMKRSVVSTVICVAVCLFFALNAATEEKGRDSKAGQKRPGASGEQLYEYITKKDPYTKWQLWPGTDKFYKGTEPHGVLLTTYVNDIALKSIKSKQPMPDGAVIVKENYTPDKKLASLTVMHKINNYNPDAGNWFWLKASPQGKIEASGKVNGCIACHGKARNDYLFTGQGK